MFVTKTSFATNQIASLVMGEREAVSSGLESHGLPAAGRPGARFLALLSVGLAAGTAALCLSLTGAFDLVLPILLGIFATLGVFFVLGLAAGHIQLPKRTRDDVVGRVIADHIGAAILITDGNGDPYYVNNGFARSIARRLASLTAFEGPVSAAAMGSDPFFRLARQAQRGAHVHEQFALTGLGETRWVRAEARPLAGSDAAGQSRLILWHITDLTDEQAHHDRMLNVLRGTLARFDRTPVGLITASADGTVTHFNDTVARWFGVAQHTLVERGLRLDDLFSADGLQLLTVRAEQGSGASRGVDLDLTRDDGGLLPVRLLVAPVEGGLSIVVLNREDEDPGARDDGLADVRFARFFRSAPFGIATVGPDGRLVSANAAFSRMLLGGASGVGEAAATLLTAAADTGVRPAIDAGLAQVLTGRGKIAPIDLALGGDDSQARRLYMSPLSGSRRAREAAVLYSIDSSELKALEAKLAQSQKMDAVGKLAGGIAHDFNNVLTVIIGYSDLLLQKHRRSDPAYQEIMYIKSSANRAASLVGKLLAFSRQQTMQAEVMQIGEVLTDLSPLLKRSIGEIIDLKIPAGRDIWPVKADKTQIEHVIINLVVNARDAMPEGGRITIRSRNVSERESQRLGHVGLTTGEYVLIEVEDSGTGMPPEVMAKIFEPFYTTKPVGKGTGLGLSTVYGIIKQSGGFIYPESTLNKGTTFRVYLPRHDTDGIDDAPVPAAKPAKKERPADLTGSGRVLLVEDEDMVRGFAVIALKSRGYEVLEASTGVEALEIFEAEQGKIDIVVSDVVMPEMDGPTLLKEMRKRKSDVKFIFVSGYPNEAFKASLDDNQQFAFLAKPFSLPDLAAKVKEELAR